MAADSHGKSLDGVANYETMLDGMFGDVETDQDEQFPEIMSTDEKIEIADRNSSILGWEGEKGNSKRIPIDEGSKLARELASYGIDGLEYRDGDIDFSPVSKFEISFSDTSELLKDIASKITMENLSKKDGTVKSRSDFNNLIRRRWQSSAIEELLNRIQSDVEFASEFQQKTGIISSEIDSVSALSSSLKKSGLTLHETPDCKKIQFVPTRIHNAYKHAGGTAEVLEKLISGDIHTKINNE